LEQKVILFFLSIFLEYRIEGDSRALRVSFSRERNGSEEDSERSRSRSKKLLELLEVKRFEGKRALCRIVLLQRLFTRLRERYKVLLEKQMEVSQNNTSQCFSQSEDILRESNSAKILEREGKQI